jgi:hypothetical protein
MSKNITTFRGQVIRFVRGRPGNPNDDQASSSRLLQVEVTVDVERLIQSMGRRAGLARCGRSIGLGGAIRARVLPQRAR